MGDKWKEQWSEEKVSFEDLCNLFKLFIQPRNCAG